MKIIITVTAADRKSAIGPANKMPSIPHNQRQNQQRRQEKQNLSSERKECTLDRFADSSEKGSGNRLQKVDECEEQEYAEEPDSELIILVAAISEQGENRLRKEFKQEKCNHA